MLPERFLQRMQEKLGEEYPAFLAGYEREPFRALRINAWKVGADGRGAIERAGELLERAAKTGRMPVPWAADAYYYPAESQPGKHPYHEAGVYYIQEPSAMLPAGLLGALPGERILDLCAAPGGKTTQLAALMQGEGILIANEIHPARAKILSENVERMGIPNALVLNETPERLAEVFPDFFDRILVDAPCSGEGMFRKSEEACGEWSPENVARCAARQDAILDRAAAMLRPGGRLVYSTCTFAVEEDEGSVERFLTRHPDFVEVRAEKLFAAAGGACGSELPFGFVCGERGVGLRLWPHRVRGEGHYAAVLERTGEASQGDRPTAATGLQRPAAKKELEDCREYFAFLEENLRQQDFFQKNLLRFGDNLYRMSEQTPGLSGLKVARPGLHLGTIRKNRFEPSHALALALSAAEVTHTWELAPGGDPEREAAAYLSGQTFPAEGEKGWYLICVDGYSLGWGKLAGGIMKNHYPKGLRRT